MFAYLGKCLNNLQLLEVLIGFQTKVGHGMMREAGLVQKKNSSEVRL